MSRDNIASQATMKLLVSSALLAVIVMSAWAVVTAGSRAFVTGASFVAHHGRPPAVSANAAVRFMARKAGVSEPEELQKFVANAGDRLLVVDVRNPNAIIEPGDQKSLAVAALPSNNNRLQAVNLIWDRTTDSMPLPDVPKDTPIITHCGGGGRGQKAKDFLQENGFGNVLNGGGPKETDCWAEYGDK